MLFRLGLSALLSISLVGCMHTPAVSDQSKDRSSVMLVSEKSWHSKAEKSYNQIVKEAKKKNTLVVDPKLDRIMHKMLPYAVEFRPEAKDWNWQINAHLNGTLNAYGFAGGKIILNTALYWQLELTEEELAFVIAHEMSHELLEHSRQKMSASLLLGSLPTYLTHGVSQMWLHESEADLLALQLMKKAGMNPKAGSSFFKKLTVETERRRQLKVNQTLMTADFMKYRQQAIDTSLSNSVS